MDEETWLKQTAHAQGMVWTLRSVGLAPGKALESKAGQRKLRLFACGCCRLLWKYLRRPGLRDAVRTAERFAEGMAGSSELASARETVQALRLTRGGYGPEERGVRQRTAARLCLGAVAHRAFEAAFDVTTMPLPLAGYCGDEAQAEAILCNLLRCIFGNPFRSFTVERSWLRWNGGTIPRIARAIYYDRAFDRMGILGDALEDAGCPDGDFLSHCRQPAAHHARGCWVLDALLGHKTYVTS
jgi:hypothetical protein